MQVERSPPVTNHERAMSGHPLDKGGAGQEGLVQRSSPEGELEEASPDTGLTFRREEPGAGLGRSSGCRGGA